MEKLGWKSGNGLGVGQSGNTVHVKVAFKKDNTGLGHKVKKRGNDDDLAEFAQGLDSFQRILGRLNGKDENKLDSALGSRRLNMVMEYGKFGMAFVYGGLLEGTVDKMFVEDSTKSKKEKSSKRKFSDAEESSRDSDSESEVEEPAKKKSRKSSKEEKKSKKEQKEKKAKKEKKEKSEKKEKKDKKEKKSKKEKEGKEKKEKKDKKEKKEKKDKKDKKDKKEKKEQVAEVEITETVTAKVTPMRGMQGTRARWIAQKRAATMDAKSLAEILMVTS